MDAKLRRGETAMAQGFDPTLHDARRRTTPTRVEESDGSARVGDEHRYTIRDPDR
jgi:hypothetical protein